MFCTDSLSTIQGLQSPNLTHPLILELFMSCHSLFKWGFNITLSWMPGHVGISGNEAADAAARDATVQDTLIPGVTNMDFRTALRQSVLAKWQRDWDCTQDNKLREVKPVVRAWRSSSRPVRRDEVVVTRLRVGHTRLTHSHLLSGNSPHVTCSVRHFLADCPRYTVQRDRFHLHTPYATF
jgi:hypothetical protein